MVGNCTGASCAWDDRFARSDKSVFGARPMRAGCEEEAHSSSCRPCVPASLVDSSGRTHRGRVSLTPWVRALLQQLRQRLVHPCTVIHRLPLTDGTGVLSQAGEALPSSKLLTVHMFKSFGIDRCARAASVWRSRLHNGGAGPAYFFLVRGGIVPASRSNIEGGIGAAALTDLLQIDACEQSIMR